MLHRSGIILVMAQPDPVQHPREAIARTIRFPTLLRDRLSVDAERCGRSFEAHVIALLRRHYGEDVDLAPSPTEILSLATASLAGISESDLASLTTRLDEATEQF